MHKLSDNIDRKFTESFDVSEWEIETDSGWEPISQSHKTIEYEVYKLTTANNIVLECADNHIVFDEHGNELFVKDSLNTRIQTKYGLDTVISVENMGYSECMYDLAVDSPNHRFYTNDILSHNTQTAAAFLLWYGLFNTDVTCAVLANKADTAREIISRLTLMLESLPFFLQPGCKNINKGSIEFSNGSTVFSAATSASSIRGRSVNLAFMDEFAHIDNADEFYTSTYPVISSGKDSKIIMTSTPNGFNLFHKFYSEALEGKNEYTPLSYTWRDDPRKGDEWERKTRASVSEQQFQQEFEADFLGSSNTLISSKCLSALTAKNPIKTIRDNTLHYYSVPKENHTYVTVVDVGRGRGLDYSTFSIIDITDYPFQVVCTFRDNNISPLMYPDIIYAVSKSYNESCILVEINDIGEMIVSSLNDDLEYENVIPSLDGKLGFGVRTTKSVKAVGCSNLKDLLESSKLITNCEWTIKELSNFIARRTSYEADTGHHDDMVMTLVLFAWLAKQPYFEELKDGNNLKDGIFGECVESLEEELCPFLVIQEAEDVEYVPNGHIL